MELANQGGLAMKALPVEFRYRVIALAEEGLTSGEIAEVLGVTAAWVRSIKQLHASGQSLEPKSCANKAPFAGGTGRRSDLRPGRGQARHNARRSSNAI